MGMHMSLIGMHMYLIRIHISFKLSTDRHAHVLCP